MLVLRGVFSLDLGDVATRARRCTLFATAGAFKSREARRVTELTAGWRMEEGRDDAGAAFGLGALYRLPRLTLRGAFEQRTGGDASASALGIAAQYRF